MELEGKNYYEILEIPFSCTQQEINHAYSRAKNAYSVDSAALYSLLTEDECRRILDAIDEAHSILGNPEKRMLYDKARGFDKARMSEDKISKASMEEKTSGLSRSDDSTMNHEKNVMKAQRDQLTKEEFNYEANQRANTVTRAEAYQKFSLNYKVDKNFEQELENITEYSGAILKKIREYKNVTIERMSEMIKVSKTHLINIEEENISKLPADAYARGFIFQYAKCLKLNPDLVAGSYLERLKKLREPANG